MHVLVPYLILRDLDIWPVAASASSHSVVFCILTGNLRPLLCDRSIETEQSYDCYPMITQCGFRVKGSRIVYIVDIWLPMFIPISPAPRLFQYLCNTIHNADISQWAPFPSFWSLWLFLGLSLLSSSRFSPGHSLCMWWVVLLPSSTILIWTFLILVNPTSTHIAIGDLSDSSLTGRPWVYVISADPLIFLLVISLTVPWLAECTTTSMWSSTNHIGIAIGDLSDCFFWLDSMWSANPLTLLLVISALTVPWLAGKTGMCSLFCQSDSTVHSYCYW